MNRTIGEVVAKHQSTASRLQNSLDRLAAINAENQSLKAALKTPSSASVKPVNIETRCQHGGNARLARSTHVLICAFTFLYQ